MGREVPGLNASAAIPIDFIDVLSTSLGGTFECQLSGEVFAIESAVVPLEEGSQVF